MSHTFEQKDLAQKDHWDLMYSGVEAGPSPGWAPASYDELALGHMLLTEIDRCKPGSLLEVGCGNSVWLPYLAKKRNLRVSGVDYSEEGCRLARKRLEAEGVEGTVYCCDLFTTDAAAAGQFDFVYSLGVVEHFSDVVGVLSHLLKFVKPGGCLLTEVPNLYSMHGVMSYLYQPALLRKHRIVTRDGLLAGYRTAGLLEPRCDYVGRFSLGVTAWGAYQRFPSLDRILLPVVYRLADLADSVLVPSKRFGGSAGFAPFLYAVGKKPQQPDGTVKADA